MGGDENGLLSSVRSNIRRNKKGCFSIIRSWDIRTEDVINLVRGRLFLFRHRKERRLFDAIDAHHTGFVTLDEIISFRERHEDADDNEDEMGAGLQTDIPLLSIQPDLTRSLVALYHFDVRLDGHLNFDEFILMQDYLHKVERTLEDEEVICCCIPKMWFKRSRVKKKSQGKKSVAFKDDVGSRTPETSKDRHGNEKVLVRKVRVAGQLETMEASDFDLSASQKRTDSGHPPNGGGDASYSPAGGPHRRGCVPSSDSDNDSEDEDADGSRAGMKRELEELRRQRRAMLVQTLKNNKGRKRFMEWLYRLTDTTHSDSIAEAELIVFLKAIAADGINPESLVDPSEDCEDHHEGIVPVVATTPPNTPARFELVNSASRLVTDEAYLKDLAQRIMMRYDDGHTGSLVKDEFMQLAAMVEREYELYHLNDEENVGISNVGSYRLIRKLGKGAEGVVMLGISKETGVKKAVKIIKRGNIASMSRIDREIEAMVVLDHPCVVSVDEVLETETSIFLVMEYCAGGHLEDYISPKRPMSAAAARFYFYQLVDGVVYCHSKGVCHRDLRVENLMLDNKGNLKITDFGHAGIFEQGWDVFQTMLVGSVSHLAPEQVEGTVYSGEKIDVWSAGIILYIMVTGLAPFQAESPEELLDLIREARYTPPDVDADCLEVIEKTLQVQQSERPTGLQLQEFDFLKGPKEKLVLQHCEFFISSRQHQPAKWIEEFRVSLRDEGVNISERELSGTPSEGDDEVEATVRTVEADEDEISTHIQMRAVSVHTMRCFHETHNVVFKVTVTMMSPDAGQKSPYPVVSFDLQSGEAAFFQRLFRRIRSKYMNQVTSSSGPLTKSVHELAAARPRFSSRGEQIEETTGRTRFTSTGYDSDAPIVEFAHAMGLHRSSSYMHALSSGSMEASSPTGRSLWNQSESRNASGRFGQILEGGANLVGSFKI